MNFQLRGFDVTPVSGRCVLVHRVPDPRALKIEGLKPSHLRYQHSATSVVPPDCHSRCREGMLRRLAFFVIGGHPLLERWVQKRGRVLLND